MFLQAVESMQPVTPSRTRHSPDFHNLTVLSRANTPPPSDAEASDTSDVRIKVERRSSSESPGMTSSSDSPPSVTVPTSHQDWENVKSCIQSLYLEQNLTLADVVRRMCTEHNFRATARMYKTQFTRWGWSKYNSKRVKREVDAGKIVFKPAGKSCRRLPRSTRVTKQSRGAQFPQQLSTHGLEAIQSRLIQQRFPGPMPGLPRADNTQLVIERVLGEVRNHIYWFHEQKTEWKHTPGVDLIQVYNYKAYDTFRSAFDHFIRNESQAGGESLRHAFVQVEGMMEVDYSGSFYCHFVELPDLLLHYKRVDVLLILLRHINKLASLKTRHSSLSHIFILLQSIVQMDPEHLGQYVEASSLLWKNILADLRGQLDRTTLMAKRNYLRHSKNVSKGQVASLCGEYDLLLTRALKHYGEWNGTIRHMEDITLSVQHNHAVYLDDFVERSELLIQRLRERYPGDKITKNEWDHLDKNIYSNTYQRLSSFYFRTGDLARAAQCDALARGGWDSSTSWNTQVEKLLCDEGKGQVAELISWTRLEGVYWDEYQDVQGQPTGQPPSVLAKSDGAPAFLTPEPSRRGSVIELESL